MRLSKGSFCMQRLYAYISYIFIYVCPAVVAFTTDVCLNLLLLWWLKNYDSFYIVSWHSTEGIVFLTAWWISWLIGFLFYSMGYCLLVLFILMLKLPWIWLFCVSIMFLEHFIIVGTPPCFRHISYVVQGALLPFSAEWYWETVTRCDRCCLALSTGRLRG